MRRINFLIVCALTCIVIAGVTELCFASIPPTTIITAKLDANPAEDIIINFGSQHGLWVYSNNSVWFHLHPISPKSITRADLDGNGIDDLVIDFGSQYGVYVYSDTGAWTQLHIFTASSITAADLDGNGKDDIIIDFGPQYGIYVYSDTGAWIQLHTLTAKSITAADLDGNGKDDIIVDFGSQYGIYVYSDTGAWNQLHNFTTKSITAADLDGNGKDDIIVDFGSEYGIYVYSDTGAWNQLHNFTTKSITAADLDGNGIDDIIIDFGSQYGIWIYYNNSTWQKLHDLSPWAVNVPPPQFTNLTDKTVVIGNLLQFTLEADGSYVPAGELAYSVAGLPPDASFDAASRTISWTPTLSDKGTYDVTFTVTNGATSSTKSIILSTVYIEEALLTNDASIVGKPSIYDDKVIWSDNRNSSYDLYLYDISGHSESLLNIDTAAKFKPAIYGDNIVYIDQDFNLYMYDLSTTQKTEVTTLSTADNGPAIYKNKIAYVADPVNICIYDIPTGQVTAISDASSSHGSLNMDENSLFWESSRLDSGQNVYDIYTYDLQAGTKSMVLNNLALCGFAAYGDKISWAQSTGLWIYNISTKEGMQLTQNSGSINLAMYEYRIVWAGDDSQIHLTAMTFSPRIISADCECGYTGYNVNITGTNLGYSQGSSNIELGGSVVNAAITSWSDTSIVCVIPFNTDLSGNQTLKVNTPGGKSNGVEITLQDLSKLPTKPTLNTFSTPTSNTVQTLSGTKDINTSIWMNGVEKVPIDSFTTWSVSITLAEGQNNINVTAKNSTGGESQSALASILLDTTPPTTPVMIDDGATTNYISTFHAVWSAQDAESGIIEYRYRITDGTNGGSVIRDWTSTGVVPEVTATELSLSKGHTYYFSVQARNGAGLWSCISSSGGGTLIQAAPDIISISPVAGSILDSENTVDFNINAIDQEGDAIQYRILVDGEIVSDWNSAPNFSWQMTSPESGARQATVYVKDTWGNENSGCVSIYLARKALELP
ncbi:MAG: putative Ig domain-containing protein [Candidatus Omnitrophica bacterium]|nr:putative Ig domain-containing protein [Candidatus Omnitrophota bacterium]